MRYFFSDLCVYIRHQNIFLFVTKEQIWIRPETYKRLLLLSGRLFVRSVTNTLGLQEMDIFLFLTLLEVRNEQTNLRIWSEKKNKIYYITYVQIVFTGQLQVSSAFLGEKS